MTTDSATLLNEAKCLGCASNASMADMLKLGLWSRIAEGTTPPVETAWSQQVLANGGPNPSQSTIIAVRDFTDALDAAGLTGKIISLCVFVPDSLIAATTPIIRTQGFTPWTNNNFVAGDLTVEGLKGNGTTKYLDTGVQANSGGAYNAGTGNCGLTEIITEAEGNANGMDIGHVDATTRALILSGSATINTIAGRTAFFSASTPVANIAFTTDWNRCGYVSGNNVSGTASIYVASPLVSHSLLTSLAIATTPSLTNETIFGFALNNSGAAQQWTNKRISVMCIHDAWTAGESATFSSLLLTLRTALGGGTGDPIVNWAARVVTLGGIAPAANTQTALRTFYSGLVSNSILSKMVSVNPYVPDNLTAARIPLIWAAGNEIWTNSNFVSGDLTVNGITGNLTTKSLATGIIPSTTVTISPNVTGFSITSAGITLMISNIPASANLYDYGAGGAIGSSQFALINNAGNIFFYCWKFINAGTDFVTFAAPAPGATWTGYLSGNRTASNAIACYRASTALAHAAGATGAGAQTGSAAQIAVETVAAAINANGVLTAWSNHTVSFLAIHSGLTEAQSLAFYNLIAALRTSLGGGNP